MTRKIPTKAIIAEEVRNKKHRNTVRGEKFPELGDCTIVNIDDIAYISCETCFLYVNYNNYKSFCTESINSNDLNVFKFTKSHFFVPKIDLKENEERVLHWERF